MSALTYRQLFRALSLIFASVALVGGCGLWLLAEGIATRWLKVSELPMSEVILAVKIMAISVALRWMGGLYRGVISGSERLVWLSAFNVIIASLRFIAVFASMWLYGFTPYVFFMHQLAIALLEVSGLFMMSRFLLPICSSLEQPIGWSIRPVKSILKFALTIAFTSSAWILVTQLDKLILSGILPLAEYGYFTLAVLVAGGIIVISGPISGALMPRMALLHAEGKHLELLALYHHATQWVTIIASSAAITLTVAAYPLLYAWTGDANLAKEAAPILQLYAIGNGLLAVGAFPYYLQYAQGDLRYHLIGNAVYIIVLLPSIVIAASNFGGLGAGYVWLGGNLMYLITWVAYVHGKLVPNLHVLWFLEILNIVVLAIAIVVLLWLWLPSGFMSLSLSYIFLVGVLCVAVSSLGSSEVRRIIFKRDR